MTRVSVIIPNRKRRESLRRAVLALRQQTFRDFELIIASDAPDIAALNLPDAERIKFTHFGDANISACRMAGVALSDAPIIAFLDDDAVPEPTWLAQLVCAFEDPKIGAVAGHVLARNGVSTQWGEQFANAQGEDCSHAEPDAVLKLHGANCAYRRDALRAIGGFDLAYRFFLDDTDAARRLAAAGWTLIYRPEAIVHHDFLPNDSRDYDRQPVDLYEIGASKAYFLASHQPDAASAALPHFRQEQAARCDADPQLVARLDAGIVEGATRSPLFNWPDNPPPAFAPFVTGPCPAPALLRARIWNRKRVLSDACERAKTERVTVIDLLPSFRPMRSDFLDDGYWHHVGGLWGRTERDDIPVKPRRIRSAFEAEEHRIRAQRAL